MDRAELSCTAWLHDVGFMCQSVERLGKTIPPMSKAHLPPFSQREALWRCDCLRANWAEGFAECDCLH